MNTIGDGNTTPRGMRVRDPDTVDPRVAFRVEGDTPRALPRTVSCHEWPEIHSLAMPVQGKGEEVYYALVDVDPPYCWDTLKNRPLCRCSLSV